MNERADWDVVGKFVDSMVASDVNVSQRALILSVIRALANTDDPAANAAWKALADEREKRERGTR